MILTRAQIADLVRRHGCPETIMPTAVAVALAESGGDTDAVNEEGNNPPSRDRGLWQVNDYWHSDVSDKCAFDPDCATEAAGWISRNWTSFSPWSAYNNGRYRLFLENSHMDVPYISQVEPDGSGYSNCGPACLTMCLAYDGLVTASVAAMHAVADYMRDGFYNGNWWLNTYTDIPMMRTMVQAIYKRDVVEHPSWPAVNVALEEGRPVILLNYNSYFLPRQYPATAAFNGGHFIVLTGYEPASDTYHVNDPLAIYQRGPGAYTGESVRRAAAGMGGIYSVSLSKEPDAVTPEQQAIFDKMQGLNANADSIDDWINQIGALRSENLSLHGEVAARDGIITEYAKQVADLHKEVAGLMDKLAAEPDVDVSEATVRLTTGREIKLR